MNFAGGENLSRFAQSGLPAYSLANFGWPKYLSGLKMCESLNSDSLWWIAHVPVKTILFFGMNMPLYQSSGTKIQ